MEFLSRRVVAVLAVGGGLSSANAFFNPWRLVAPFENPFPRVERAGPSRIGKKMA